MPPLRAQTLALISKALVDTEAESYTVVSSVSLLASLAGAEKIELASAGGFATAATNIIAALQLQGAPVVGGADNGGGGAATTPGTFPGDSSGGSSSSSPATTGSNTDGGGGGSAVPGGVPASASAATATGAAAPAAASARMIATVFTSAATLVQTLAKANSGTVHVASDDASFELSGAQLACPGVGALTNKSGKSFGWVFFLISSGSPHVRPMGRTCGEPDEIELTAMGVKLNGSRCRPRPARRRRQRPGHDQHEQRRLRGAAGLARLWRGGRGAVVLVSPVREQPVLLEEGGRAWQRVRAASRSVSPPMGGQFDFVWPCPRTPHVAYVWRA